MRLLRPLAFLALLTCLRLSAAAQDNSWQTVSIPDICTYQIPPTLEIQKGNYKILNDALSGLILNISYSLDRVIAQPKGINSLDRQALKLYCRVIVETDRGRPGEYEALDTPLALSKEELLELGTVLKQEMQQAVALLSAKGVKMELLSWQPGRIVSVNGVDALRVTYTRSMNDGPPAIVNMYQVQNNDYAHQITISYRLSEESLWATDLGRIIDTFKFKKR